jgi:hypothetical protein
LDVQHHDTSSFADNSIAKEGTPPGLPPTSTAHPVELPDFVQPRGGSNRRPALLLCLEGAVERLIRGTAGSRKAQLGRVRGLVFSRGVDSPTR